MSSLPWAFYVFSEWWPLRQLFPELADRERGHRTQMNFRAIDVTSPLNRIRSGYAALAVNVRARLSGGFMLRSLLTNSIITVSGIVNTIARLNDTTPAGPAQGYTLISAAGTSLFNNATSIATGMSGNQVSMVPNRPNASVAPWEYVGDAAPGPAVIESANNIVTLSTTSLYSGSPVTFLSNRMLKVSSTGLVYKMGIKEPQLAPTVSTQNTNVVVTGPLLATAIPWTNFGGANPDFNYGETNGFPSPTPDGTAPFEISVENATTVTITSLTGTATINGGSKTPTSLGPATSASTNPGHYIQILGSGGTPATATVVTGAFMDASGNVLPVGIAPLFIPSVFDVGGSIGTAIRVPANAVTLQIGINSTGNTYSSNSGSFALSATVTTDALSPNLGVIGNLTLSLFQDSPTSGPVASYIWSNPGESGGGTPRSISSAVGTNTGNSFIFDATFTAGIPSTPGIGTGTTPMIWSQLNSDDSVSSTIDVSPTQTSNFNFCLVGSIYIPAPGNYTFELTNHDDCIWGIEGATLISATASGVGEGGVSLSDYGQTLTVAKGYPLLPRQTYTSGNDNNYAQITVVVSFASAGVFGIELDGDYWYRAGRIFLLMGSPTPGAPVAIIPPGSPNQRQQVQYRYVYRSSATGAQSNPSPESAAITLPVLSNTVTSFWSPDPQVDLVDYYRLDSTTASFTYVATGPNDNLGGGGTNTPIVDSLPDTELSNQLLVSENYEPFPSIDLPQKGTCSVSGGVITWLTGGSIGSSATGFNTRWLGGTIIVIGSPTGLAYVMIARPTSTTTMTIPGVPDQTNVQYTIPEPTLAAQALPYLFGPTDNIIFTYGVGDPLRPGTMYWNEGGNLDAAPDTNQMDVTDPSEALVNGAMTGGLGALFSIKRGWIIEPNFYNALATVTGTEGSTWSLRETAITRGLFIPRCVAVSGGGNIYFRVNDGIHVSPGGAASKSISDDTLYSLFPHETTGQGSTAPSSITRNGITIYPPDDTQPQKQKFSWIAGYMYYDYFGTDANPHTLVFDEMAEGWIYDMYSVGVTARAANEGLSTQGVLVGCTDGTIRMLATGSSATETATATVVSGAIGARGYTHCGELVLEYSCQSPITLTGIAADEGNGSYGFPAITLPSTGGQITKYFVRPAPNKWKLLQFQWTFSDPTAQVYIDGCCGKVKAWGSDQEYQAVPMFAAEGGQG